MKTMWSSSGYCYYHASKFSLVVGTCQHNLTCLLVGARSGVGGRSLGYGRGDAAEGQLEGLVAGGSGDEGLREEEREGEREREKERVYLLRPVLG